MSPGEGLTLAQGLLLIIAAAIVGWFCYQVWRAHDDMTEAAAEQRKLRYELMALYVRYQGEQQQWIAARSKERLRRLAGAQELRRMKETLAEIQELFLAYGKAGQLAPDLDPVQRDLSNFGRLYTEDEHQDTVPQQ